MFQHREASNFPWVSQSEWLYSQLVRWDGLHYDPAEAHAAARVFRPDVYRSALRDTPDQLPTSSSKVEGSVSGALEAHTHTGTMILENNTFFDGISFDPDRLADYIASQK